MVERTTAYLLYSELRKECLVKAAFSNMWGYISQYICNMEDIYIVNSFMTNLSFYNVFVLVTNC